MGKKKQVNGVVPYSTTSISIKPATRDKLAVMFPKTHTWDDIVQELLKSFEGGRKQK